MNKIIRRLFSFQFQISADEELNIAQGFRNQWLFPNCGGAMDGKHITIMLPDDSGSISTIRAGSILFYWLWLTRLWNSLWLMWEQTVALQTQGVFIKSEFNKRLENNSLNLPSNDGNNQTRNGLNFVFIGDEAFGLKPNFLNRYV